MLLPDDAATALADLDRRIRALEVAQRVGLGDIAADLYALPVGPSAYGEWVNLDVIQAEVVARSPKAIVMVRGDVGNVATGGGRRSGNVQLGVRIEETLAGAFVGAIAVGELVNGTSTPMADRICGWTIITGLTPGRGYRFRPAMFAVDTGGGSGSAPYSAYTSVLAIPT